MFITILSFYTLVSASVCDAHLAVQIHGLRSQQGKVACALYAPEHAASFPSNHAEKHTVVPISDHTATCHFHDVRQGTYALAVFHDENDNGKLDTNFMGIPIEGAGASNDAKSAMGPPKFADASFRYAGGQQTMTINLTYWQGFMGYVSRPRS